MCEHVDDRAARVLDEEAVHAPGLIGQRVDDAQATPHDLSVSGIDGSHITDIDTEPRLRILIPTGGMMT